MTTAHASKQLVLYEISYTKRYLAPVPANVCEKSYTISGMNIFCCDLSRGKKEKTLPRKKQCSTQEDLPAVDGVL